MSVDDKFKTTSGKEITVNFDESGEPTSVEWIGEPKLTENEIYDIYDHLDNLSE